MHERWKRVAFLVGAAIAGLLVVYVAFAHVLAASRMGSLAPKDFRESFATSDHLPPGYEAKKTGGLTYAVRGGVIAIEGSGKADDEVAISSPARRFEDGLVTIRFRSKTSEPLEVFLGLEQRNGRRATAGWTAGPTPLVHMGGDVTGPYRSAHLVEDVHLEDAGLPMEPGAWHNLSIQFAPRYTTGVALLDGKPLTAVSIGWPLAAESRIVFGVRARGDVSNVGVEIESLSYQTLDEMLSSFDETFNGEILDTQRWVVFYPDANLATMSLRLEKGQGLVLDARAHAIVRDHVPFYFVRTPPFPLRTLRATADITVDDAENGRVFFGLLGSSAWTSPDKVFDLGVAEHGEEAVIDAAGAWDNTGVLAFDLGPRARLPQRYKLEIRYDASTGLGTASVDGRKVGEHLLDMKPLDFVSVRLGSGGSKIGAHTKVTVHRISLEMK